MDVDSKGRCPALLVVQGTRTEAYATPQNGETIQLIYALFNALGSVLQHPFYTIPLEAEFSHCFQRN